MRARCLLIDGSDDAEGWAAALASFAEVVVEPSVAAAARAVQEAARGFDVVVAMPSAGDPLPLAGPLRARSPASELLVIVEEGGEAALADLVSISPFAGTLVRPIVRGPDVVHPVEAIREALARVRARRRHRAWLAAADRALRAGPPPEGPPAGPRLDPLLAALPVGVALTDRAGTIAALNAEMATLAGCAAAEAAGRPLQDVLRPEPSDVLGALLRAGSGASEPITFEIRPASGSPRVVRATAAPVVGGEDVVLVLDDVTEELRAAEARRALERRLLEAQRLESLGSVAAGVAHDFNNILTGILGNAALALDDPHDPDFVARCLEEIRAGAERAAELSRSMLYYSGQTLTRREPVRLDDVVAEVLELLRISHPARFARPPEAVWAIGDGAQIGQVVANLVRNACEALGARGAAEVRVGSEPLEREALERLELGAACEPGPYAYVEVADDGPGFDVETRRRLFDPFFSTRFAGRGLGLAAVYGLVRAHRGAIEVESEPGRGARFKVLLPLARPPAESASASEGIGPLEGAAWGPVLVVDDEEAVRELACRLLRRAGLEAASASDGGAGLAELGRLEGRVAAVLLDVTMPGLGGRETLRRLRGRWPRLPVVLMSGYSVDRVQDLLDERTSFLSKPFTARRLVGAIRERLAAEDRAS